MATIPTLVGPYSIVRKLGEGGMGEVYEARHQTIERQVAIKILRPQHARDAEINQRFVNEARAVNLINHPGLVQVSDCGQLADGSLYIVMEYLRGETLGQRLKKLGGWLPVSQVLYITWQVASTLVAAHEVGITHRDLKPDNIMLVADPICPTGERAKLLDFGIARLATDSLGGQSLTGNRILGTPIYMSPEQCRGVGAVDAKSDVYSLGVMLYQLLAGRPPFVSTGLGEVINMHISQEPPSLRDLAPDVATELVTLVHKLLNKNPDQRPAMLEVTAELEALQTRQGSAGAQMTGVAPEPAPYFVNTGEKLSDSLASILGEQIEEEGTLAEGSAAGSLAMANEQTVPSGPEAQQARPEVPKSGTGQATGAAIPSPSQEDSPTSISAGYSLGGWGERLQPPARQSVRWSLIPAAVVVVGMAAAATWLLLPARVVNSRTAPRATSVAEAVGSPPVQPPAPFSPVVRPMVSWSLESVPSAARVVRADTNEVLGITPWHTEPSKGIGSLVVRLRYPGFADKEVRFDYSQSSNQKARLIQLRGTPVQLPDRRSVGEKQDLHTQLPEGKGPDAPPKPQFKYFD